MHSDFKVISKVLQTQKTINLSNYHFFLSTPFHRKLVCDGSNKKNTKTRQMLENFSRPLKNKNNNANPDTAEISQEDEYINDVYAAFASYLNKVLHLITFLNLEFNPISQNHKCVLCQ
jgi:hypothetical protein